MLLDRKALAYASSALAASMMQAAFSFYYINVYLQRFHVSRGWFQVAQVGGAAVGDHVTYSIVRDMPGALKADRHWSSSGLRVTAYFTRILNGYIKGYWNVVEICKLQYC